MKKPIILMLFMLIPVIACAETIKLKSGKVVEGKIIEQTNKYIKIDFHGVPLTYYTDEIQLIGEKKIVETSSSAGIPETPKTVEQVIQLIRNKIMEIKTLSFVLTQEDILEDGTKKSQEKQVWIKFPDKRKEAWEEDGVERGEIRNGNIEWIILHPKDIVKYVRSSVVGGVLFYCPHFSISDDGKLNQFDKYFNYSGESAASGLQLKYSGVDNIDGFPCYLLENERFALWVGVKDGFIRKGIQKSFQPEQQPESVRVFKEVKVNVDIDDNIFEYTPVPGAMVSERVIGQDGVEKETRQMVPYREGQSFKQSEATKSKLAEIGERYKNSKGFFCKYQESEKQDYETEVNGKRVRPIKKIEGVLKFKQPAKINFMYEIRGLVEFIPVQKAFYISDGISSWEYEQVSDSEYEKQHGKFVMKNNLGENKNYFEKMEKEIPMDSIIPRARGTFPPSPVVSFITEPFKGIDPEAISYEKEEVIEGVETYLFSVKETERNRKAMFWIGKDDGIPRRIHEYGWRGDEIQTEYELSDVKAGLSMADDEFVFSNDGSFKVNEMHPTGSIEEILKGGFPHPD